MHHIIRHAQLGSANFGWLNAKHHFSFGRYHNPARMGFGVLRVVNDDAIQAGGTFPPHPHDNMEIITYVRRGAIHHGDDLGNHGITPAGDVQVMSAGTGITHSEAASPTEDTSIYQIWLHPHTQGVAPRWEQASVASMPTQAPGLTLMVSGHASDAATGALFIHQHARLWVARLAAGQGLTHSFGPRAYVLMSVGQASVQGQALHQGDGMAVEGEETLTLTNTGPTPAELLIIEFPA